MPYKTAPTTRQASAFTADYELIQTSQDVSDVLTSVGMEFEYNPSFLMVKLGDGEYLEVWERSTSHLQLLNTSVFKLCYTSVEGSLIYNPTRADYKASGGSLEDVYPNIMRIVNEGLADELAYKIDGMGDYIAHIKTAFGHVIFTEGHYGNMRLEILSNEDYLTLLEDIETDNESDED